MDNFINIIYLRQLMCGQLYIRQYLKSNYSFINMSADTDKSILIRAYQCKLKSKFSIQQFLDIVNTEPKLNKISEKGLFILYLCQLLLKAYIANGLKIRNFMSQFDIKQVKKRQKREGGAEPRRRKPKKNQANRGNKTLEQLSDQSLSNPSNVQRPRINVENRGQDTSNQVPSKDKSQQSNGSKQNNRQNNLRLQLNKITEQLKGHEQTFVDPMDFLPGTNFDDNSQSSSSQYSSEISNLSEKVKIFTNIKSSQTRGTTTRRKTGNANTGRQTKTKKKRFDIIDQTTYIEETRATENDATLNYTQISHFDSQQIQDLDIANNFMNKLGLNGLNQKQISLDLFKKDKIDALKSVLLSQRIIQPDDNDYGNFGIMQNNEDNDLAFPDYTMSQPTSAPLFDQQFFKQSLQIKDSEFSFQDLAKNSSKDKATLFYQLLWREQNDELELQQKRPQEFSMITIKHK